MKFENTEVFNFEGAFRGMRNPLNSWEKSDSCYALTSSDESSEALDDVAFAWVEKNHECLNDPICPDTFEIALMRMEDRGSWPDASTPAIYHNFFIGPNDMDLAQRLIKGGSEHSKFLRQIIVNVDIIANRGLWSEFDTYHFNTKNSCSTMHKLFDKKNPITLDMFSYEQEDEDFMKMIVEKLNCLRNEYFSSEVGTSKNEVLARAKKLLPEGYLQKRTVTTNYAELRNMYFQRRFHRLRDWRVDFVNWINTLPWAEELIKYEG